MGMLLQIALVLLLVGGGWTMLTRGRRTDRKDALTMRRVDAYIETIRRERNNPELAAMSDSELRDLLHSGARNMQVAEQKKNWVLLGCGVATLLAAIVVANQEGWMGFGIAFGPARYRCGASQGRIGQRRPSGAAPEDWFSSRRRNSRWDR